MDIFKINLKTKFMRKVISKILCNIIRDKYNIDIDLNINEMSINKSEEDAYIKMDFIAKINEKEIYRLFKDI